MYKFAFFISFLFILVTNVFAESSRAIDRYVIELSQASKFENGLVKHKGLFNNAYALITSGDEFPEHVIENAFDYLGDNLQFLRVYKINDKKINDGRAIAYVSVFGSLAASSANHTLVNFYYVFSNYRGRVILHMTSDGRL